MARVKFTDEFNYTPSEDRRVSILYKAGITYSNVRKEAADQAVALKRGAILPTDRAPSARRR